MGNAVATLKGFSKMLDNPQIKARLGAVATTYITPERIIRIATAAASRNPKLAQCTPESVLQSLMAASQVGLEPGSVLGHAYLIPRRNSRAGTMECQFQVGYQGYRELVLRSGNYRDMEARAVFERDEFECELGLTPKLTHKPYFGADGRGGLRFVYSIAWPSDPRYQPSFEVMSIDEVEAIRQRSQSGDSGPWRTDFTEMAKKTVVIRHRKILRLDTTSAEQVQMAVELEDLDVMRSIDPEAATQDMPEADFEVVKDAPTKTDEALEKAKAARPKKKDAPKKKKAKAPPADEPEPEATEEPEVEAEDIDPLAGRRKQLANLRDKAREADLLDSASEQDIADVLEGNVEDEEDMLDLWCRHISKLLLKGDPEKKDVDF